MGTRKASTRGAGLAAALERRAASLRRLTGPHVGVDVVSIARWEGRLKLGGEALLNRIYTEGELQFAAGRMERLATRLAAKEAVLKALGTGIRGIALKNVEIRMDPRGRPTIKLDGPADRRARELGLDGIAISLCHEEGYAVAVAAGFRSPRRTGVARRRSGTPSRT